MGEEERWRWRCEGARRFRCRPIDQGERVSPKSTEHGQGRAAGGVSTVLQGKVRWYTALMKHNVQCVSRTGGRERLGLGPFKKWLRLCDLGRAKRYKAKLGANHD